MLYSEYYIVQTLTLHLDSGIFNDENKYTTALNNKILNNETQEF